MLAMVGEASTNPASRGGAHSGIRPAEASVVSLPLKDFVPLFVLSLLTLAAQASTSLPDDVALWLADWLESACFMMSGEKWHRHGEALLFFTFRATRLTAKPMYLCRLMVLGLPEDGATTAKPLQVWCEFAMEVCPATYRWGLSLSPALSHFGMFVDGSANVRYSGA